MPVHRRSGEQRAASHGKVPTVQKTRRETDRAGEGQTVKSLEGRAEHGEPFPPQHGAIKTCEGRGEPGPELRFEITPNWRGDKRDQRGQVSDAVMAQKTEDALPRAEAEEMGVRVLLSGSQNL